MLHAPGKKERKKDSSPESMFSNQTLVTAPDPTTVTSRTILRALERKLAYVSTRSNEWESTSTDLDRRISVPARRGGLDSRPWTRQSRLQLGMIHINGQCGLRNCTKPASKPLNRKLEIRKTTTSQSRSKDLSSPSSVQGISVLMARGNSRTASAIEQCEHHTDIRADSAGLA